MAQLTWDQTGERFYETGVKKGVLYVYDIKTNTYGNGVAWDGLTAVTESPSGAEANPLYADDIKYLNLLSNEEFGFSIEAYQSPKEFDECDGTASPAKGIKLGQQKRKTFGFCYRTTLGNDIEGSDYGYKIHIIYGALAAPSERAYATVNDSPEAITLSWECTTTPVEVTGFKPTSHIEITSTDLDETKLKAIEDKLYGTESEEPTLPMPDELVALIGTEG